MLTYNYNDLIFDLTPVELRNLAHQEWLQALAKPLKTLKNDTVVPYYIDSKYEIQHTGQTLSLEHILNDYYNLTFPEIAGHTIPFTGNSIYVIDAERFWLDEVYTFNKGNDADSSLNWNQIYSNGVNPIDPYDGQLYLFNKSELLDQTFEDNNVCGLYNKSEFENDQYDFIIAVDAHWLQASTEKINYIHAIANKYHVAGYSHCIMTYTSGALLDTPIYSI